MPAAQRKARTVRPVEDVADGLPGAVPAAFAVKPDGRTKAARELRRVQAATVDPKVRLPAGERAVELPDGLSAPLLGKYFRVREKVAFMALMQWAAVLESVVDVLNREQLVGFYKLLKAVVHPEAWDAFCEHATETLADDADLLAFYNAAMEAMTGRPTPAPAAS